MRNTAPSVLAGCLHISETAANSIVVISPSDHKIEDTVEFHRALKLGLSSADSGRIVTFGKIPERAETGYGYIQVEKFMKDHPMRVVTFTEKPSAELALSMKNKGNFLWNTGIFMCKASVLVEEFKKFMPDLFIRVTDALERSQLDMEYLRLDPQSWKECSNISLDYAIIERTKNIETIYLGTSWSDLGSWGSLWENSNKDRHGNVQYGNATTVDCENSLIRSEDNDLEIVGLGLKNILAVATKDAVLISDKNQSENIKLAVKEMKDKKRVQASLFNKDYRPWGWFEVLTKAANFQVKRIFVKANSRLSLQSHKYRTEHWVVVTGTARVIVDSLMKELNEGESVFIPLGAIHRLENANENPLNIIEVQTGSYLGEDDIVRYEDDYSRT